MNRRQFLTALALAAAGAGSNDDARLLAAIEQVESGGRADAVGDGGKAIGILQLWPIYVDEANRIAGTRRWSYDDRLDVDKSRAMYRLVSGHWSRHWRDYSAEGIARRHNGGPRGHLKQATLQYWRKVRRELGSDSN